MVDWAKTILKNMVATVVFSNVLSLFFLHNSMLFNAILHNSCTHSQFSISNLPYVHVSELWEEPSVPGENMQIPHRKDS